MLFNACSLFPTAAHSFSHTYSFIHCFCAFRGWDRDDGEMRNVHSHLSLYFTLFSVVIVIDSFRHSSLSAHQREHSIWIINLRNTDEPRRRRRFIAIHAAGASIRLQSAARLVRRFSEKTISFGLVYVYLNLNSNNVTNDGDESNASTTAHNRRKNLYFYFWRKTVFALSRRPSGMLVTVTSTTFPFDTYTTLSQHASQLNGSPFLFHLNRVSGVIYFRIVVVVVVIVISFVAGFISCLRSHIFVFVSSSSME